MGEALQHKAHVEENIQEAVERLHPFFNTLNLKDETKASIAGHLSVFDKHPMPEMKDLHELAQTLRVAAPTAYDLLATVQYFTGEEGYLHIKQKVHGSYPSHKAKILLATVLNQNNLLEDEDRKYLSLGSDPIKDIDIEDIGELSSSNTYVAQGFAVEIFESIEALEAEVAQWQGGAVNEHELLYFYPHRNALVWGPDDVSKSVFQ